MKKKRYVHHDVPDSYLKKWQKTVDVMAQLFEVPAGLIMRVHAEKIEVLLASRSEGNPYRQGEMAELNIGLYCEQVMQQSSQLMVTDALKDPKWENNPDVKLNMISYLGIPLILPDNTIFGTICVLDSKAREYSQSFQELLWQFKEIIEADFTIQIQQKELQDYIHKQEDLISEKAKSLSREISEHKQTIHELRRTHDILERIFSSTHLSVAYMDRDFNFIKVNQRYAQADAKSSGFFVGKNHFDLYPNEENQRIFEQVIKTGQPYTVYAKPFCYPGSPDGITFWDWTLDAVKNDRDIVEGLLLTLQNVTTRKKEEEKYRNTIEISMDGFCIVATRAHFLDANDSFCKMLGYNRDELLNKTIMDIEASKSTGEIERHIQDVIANGCDRFETKLRQKNGNVIDVDISTTYQPEGEGLFFSFVRDITKRKLAVENLRKSRDALQASERRATALLTTIPDLMFRLDKNGVVLDYEADESDLYSQKNIIIGEKVSDILPVEVADLVKNKIKQTLCSGAMHTFVYQLDMPELGMTHYESRMVKCAEDEVIAIVRNVTDLKKAEEEKVKLETKLQQRQKMEAIGLMAGGVAHDLNNILVGITGYPQLLLLQLPEESNLRKPIEAIKTAGERAAVVVSDLLTIARGVANAMTVTNLNVLIVEYLDSLEHRHLHSLYPQVHYHQRLDNNLLNISCSPVHIKKCIMNLVTNAAESIDTPGSITLSTRIITPDLQWTRENRLKQTQYVVLQVKDTGNGIPEKDIKHIFEPFYTKKVMGKSGTGLGLTVVWNTVREHGGIVTVRSSEQGTSFELFFPVTGENVADSVSIDQESYKGRGEKILIVDDEPQILDIASNILGVLGYDVACVTSGEDAVSYLQDDQVDLVLLDMLMGPGINGRQTYERIIKFHPGQKAIIISGFTENDDVKASFKLGARGFIKKPFSMDQLGQAVKDALNK